MSKKIIIGTAISVATMGLILLVPLAANAQTAGVHSQNGNGFGSSNGLEIKAQAVEMTTEQLTDQLQTKTMSEVISDKGLTIDQYHENIQVASQEHWQEMGLSESEVQQKTEEQTQRQADCDGTGLNLNQGTHRNGRSNQ